MHSEPALIPSRTPLRPFSLLATLLVVFALVAVQARPALAHRVNVFAWVEGGAIHCESAFSSGNPARDTRVTITSAANGAVFGTGTTDAKGRCALPVTPEMRASKADLVIEVQAGEGHRNTWTMPAEEYLAAPTTAAQPDAQGGPAVEQPPTTQDASKAPSYTAQAVTAAGTRSGAATKLDEAALRRIVAEAVAEQVAPLRHSLAAMQSGGPRMSDVAGGIGYIVGLAGIALWARSRRR